MSPSRPPKSPVDVAPDGRRVATTFFEPRPDHTDLRQHRMTLALFEGAASEPRKVQLEGGTVDVTTVAGKDGVTLLHRSDSTDATIVEKWNGDAAPTQLGAFTAAADIVDQTLTRFGSWVLRMSERGLEVHMLQGGGYALLPRFSFRSPLERDLAVAILRDATNLRGTASGSSVARVDATIGRTTVALLSVPAAATIAPVTRDGVAANPYVVPTIDTSDLLLQAISADAGDPRLLAFSAEGPFIATTTKDSDAVTVYALSDGSRVARIPVGAEVEAAAFTADGDSLWILDKTLTARRFFLRAAPRPCGDPNAPCTRDWVKDLGAFVSGDRIKDSLVNFDPNSPGVRQLEPQWLFGPRRDDFMKRLRAAAASGDRGAQHVLRQIEGR